MHVSITGLLVCMEVVCEESIGVKMNDLDLLEVV